MREIRRKNGGISTIIGITPAYAGNTTTHLVYPFRAWDHPRLCGKYAVTFLALISALGITPAYAGNTVISCILIIPFRDHPRLCGKYKLTLTGRQMMLGSPPPMREILTIADDEENRKGITPAYAGNTHLVFLHLDTVTDHPRLCGKYISSGIRVTHRPGSPPPMREILRGRLLAMFE